MHCILQCTKSYLLFFLHTPFSLEPVGFNFHVVLLSLVPWFTLSLCLEILSISYPWYWWFTSWRLWNQSGVSTFANTDAEPYITKISFKPQLIKKRFRLCLFQVYLLLKVNICLSHFPDLRFQFCSYTQVNFPLYDLDPISLFRDWAEDSAESRLGETLQC